MTTEELIAAGLPVDPVVEGGENAAPTENAGSPSGSRSREDGEVQSDDDEDIGDVDAGVSDLVKAKTATLSCLRGVQSHNQYDSGI
jgi:hypothetical protein